MGVDCTVKLTLMQYLVCIPFMLTRLKEAGFPIRFLPEVRDPGFQAGCLAQEYFGISAGTPVDVALGDLQCSVLASISCSTDAGEIVTRQKSCCNLL